MSLCQYRLTLAQSGAKDYCMFLYESLFTGIALAWSEFTLKTNLHRSKNR